MSMMCWIDSELTRAAAVLIWMTAKVLYGVALCGCVRICQCVHWQPLRWQWRVQVESAQPWYDADREGTSESWFSDFPPRRMWVLCMSSVRTVLRDLAFTCTALWHLLYSPVAAPALAFDHWTQRTLHGMRRIVDVAVGFHSGMHESRRGSCACVLSMRASDVAVLLRLCSGMESASCTVSSRERGAL
jgi:hypothetical protein